MLRKQLTKYRLLLVALYFIDVLKVGILLGIVLVRIEGVAIDIIIVKLLVHVIMWGGSLFQGWCLLIGR